MYRQFVAPTGLPGDRWFLRFEGAAHRTIVYLNGKQVIENEDAFTPFEAEITDIIRPGKTNEILVGCAHWKSMAKSGRRPLPFGSFWGEHVVGIWQDVYVVRRPETFIRNVLVETPLNPSTLRLHLSLDTGESESRKLRLVHEVIPWSAQTPPQDWQIIFLSATQVQTVPGEIINESLESLWKAAKIWWPHEPNLYLLRTRLLNPSGGIVDEVTTRFGFREFRIDQDRFLLNGVPIRLRADSWHYLGTLQQSKEYARLWYQMARETGLNAVRLHAQPYPRCYLDAADEEGMLIVDESALWASGLLLKYDSDFWRRYSEHLKSWVVRDRNHPSVVLWSIANETFAAHEIDPHDDMQSQQELAANLLEGIRLVSSLSPSCPVYSEGDRDLEGNIPLYSLHYPNTLTRPPINVPLVFGEEGPMHFARPNILASVGGDRVYASRQAWLKAIGEYVLPYFSTYREWAALIGPFNTVWYSLEPLPFRERESSWKENNGTDLPFRAPPYCLTLNPNYDPSLPPWRANSLRQTISRTMQPVCFFVPRSSRELYGGSPLKIPVRVHNDALAKKTLILNWSVEREGKPIAQEERLASLQPTEFSTEIISFEVPEVTRCETLSVNVRLLERDGKLCSERIDYRVHPSTPSFEISLADDVQVGYLGTSSIPYPRGIRPIQANQIGELGIQDVLIVGKQTKLSPQLTRQIQTKVQQGMKLIVLSPHENLLSQFTVSGLTEFASYERMFVLDPNHPVFDTIGEKSLKFWLSKGKVGSWLLQALPRIPSKPLLGTGDGKIALLEIPFGAGCVIVCGCDILERVLREPPAERLGTNLIRYLINYEPVPPARAGYWGPKESSLASLVRDLGTEVEFFNDSITPASFEQVDILYADASQMIPTMQQIQALESFLAEEKTIVLWGTSSDSLDAYQGILPCTLELVSCHQKQVIKNATDPLLAGLQNADLFWLEQQESKNVMSTGFLVGHLDRRVEVLLRTPDIDWTKWCWRPEAVKTSALLKSTLAPEPSRAALVRMQAGKGMVIICQMLYDPNYEKSRKVTRILLHNLGATVARGGPVVEDIDRVSK